MDANGANCCSQNDQTIRSEYQNLPQLQAEGFTQTGGYWRQVSSTVLIPPPRICIEGRPVMTNV
jgi:hypothetical protein